MCSAGWAYRGKAGCAVRSRRHSPLASTDRPIDTYRLAGGIVAHDRLGEGYYHELALLSALELLGDVDP